MHKIQTLSFAHPPLKILCLQKVSVAISCPSKLTHDDFTLFHSLKWRHQDYVKIKLQQIIALLFEKYSTISVIHLNYLRAKSELVFGLSLSQIAPDMAALDCAFKVKQYINTTLHMFGLLYVHLRRMDFSLSLYRCSHQGSTPTLTDFVTLPLCFLTAYKSSDILPLLAGTPDSKYTDPDYSSF